jgi:hypothetical protein
MPAQISLQRVPAWIAESRCFFLAQQLQLVIINPAILCNIKVMRKLLIYKGIAG